MKQIKKDCFEEGKEKFVSPLLGATRMLDRWNSELHGTPIKVRICIDLSRKVNPHLKNWKFVYQDMREILSHLDKDAFLASFDLDSFYLYLPLHRYFRDYCTIRCPVTQKLLRYKPRFNIEFITCLECNIPILTESGLISFDVNSI